MKTSVLDNNGIKIAIEGMSVFVHDNFGNVFEVFLDCDGFVNIAKIQENIEIMPSAYNRIIIK